MPSQSPATPAKIAIGCLVLVLGFFGMMTVCVMALPDPSPSTVETAQVDRPASAAQPPAYTVLRSWKPGNAANGYGADVLINDGLDQVDESHLVALVQSLSSGRDPAVIRVYSSRAAFEQGGNNVFGDEWKSGYILFYVRNATGRGAYRGFNEIRWMQEIGKFSDKYGTQTQF